MRNSNEISAELDAKLRELEACQDAAQRKTLAEETDALTNEFNEASVSEAARRALANQRTLSPNEKDEMKRFSISKFLRQAASGNLDGIEAEMADEGKREFQESIPGAAEGVFIPSTLLRYYDTNASEANYGQAFVEQKSLTYVDALRNAMLGTKLGVRYLDGLVGNVAFVKNGGATAAWYAEEASASLSKPTYTKVTMSPKRLQVVQGVTYDLLHQSSLAVDRLIMDDLTKAHASALDAAIFNGSGSSGQPTGVLSAANVNSITIDASNGGPLTYALLVQMETEVAVDNALLDNLAYVSNAKVQGKMKTIPQIAGYPVYLLNDGKVNGYPFYMSNAIPSNLGTGTAFSAAIFGAWSEAFVGGWGGLQFIIDPYSEKLRGVLEISAAAYHDVLIRRPEAFCKIVDITTA